MIDDWNTAAYRQINQKRAGKLFDGNFKKLVELPELCLWKKGAYGQGSLG
jgi:hypothetical protein